MALSKNTLMDIGQCHAIKHSHMTFANSMVGKKQKVLQKSTTDIAKWQLMISNAHINMEQLTFNF